MASLENTVEVFKEIHPQFILLFQFGNFYRVYGRDALLMAYIFGYQLNEVQNMKTWKIGIVPENVKNWDSPKKGHCFLNKNLIRNITIMLQIAITYCNL